MYGISSFREQLLRLSVSHVLMKKNMFGYAFVNKCVIIPCLVGIMFFVYATGFLVPKYYVLIKSVHELHFRSSQSHMKKKILCN